MRRRNVLERTVVLSTLGTSAVAGCLVPGADDTVTRTVADLDFDCVGTDDTTETDADGPAERSDIELDAAEWVHDIGGDPMTVAEGLVLGHENLGDENADGGVFALEAATGEHQWTYGSSGGFSRYSSLAVEDAIYVGWGDDEIGNGSGFVHAIEFDGTERWTNDVGSVYYPPLVAADTVYVGSDDGVIRAFEAGDGSERWASDLVDEGIGSGFNAPVKVVEDIVFVAADSVAALDRADGSIRWRYDGPNGSVHNIIVRDGVAYITEADSVIAVKDGDPIWKTLFETNPLIQHIAADRVIVKHGSDLYGLDAATGEGRWILENDDRALTAFDDETMYVGTEDGSTVRAMDFDCPDERWSVSVGDGASMASVWIVDNPSGADHSVYVETDDATLHEVSTDGDVVRSASLPGDPYSFAADGTDRTIVGTREMIYSIPGDAW